MNDTRPTKRQRKAAERVIKKGESPSRAMRKVGYSKGTSKNPKNLTQSKGWEQLMNEYLPDSLVAETHQNLLKASAVDHMVFPLDATDDDIIDLLAEANCKVKRFMHSDMQTHVWYFAADNNARKAAIDMAYKLKGKYAAEKVDHTTKGEKIGGFNFIKPDGTKDNNSNDKAAA